MKTVSAGSLVHDVLIQQLTETRGATSKAPVESWTTLEARVPMQRQASRGNEVFTADQLSGSVVTTWTMRYLSTMDPDLIDVPKKRRLVYRGRAHDILSAEPMDRKVGLVLRTLASTEVRA